MVAEIGDRRRLPWIVAGVGLVSILMLLGTDDLRRRSILRHAAALKAIHEIQRDMAIAHLWLEEHVSGDAVDTSEIGGRLGRSLDLLAQMLGKQSVGTEVGPFASEELAALAAELEHEVQEFQRLSELRLRGLESSLAVGIGSAFDVEYDVVFAAALGQAQALEAALESSQKRHRDQARVLFVLILLSWAVLIAVATVGLWNRERQRLRAEAALAESEAQLWRAQKLEAVGRLASGLAHDIANYLAAIRGHCELVLKKPAPDERTAARMQAVVRTIGRATALLDRLRVLGQRQPASLEVLELNRVVDELEKMLTPNLGEGVELDLRLAADLRPVAADPSQLEQVVVNLVLNARDAMPGGGRIRIETSNVTLPVDEEVPETSSRLGRRQVMLAVSDTGCGIAPEALDSIFDPFWTTKDPSSHSGLGPGHGLRDRPATQRPDGGDERAGQRDDLSDLPAGSREEGRRLSAGLPIPPRRGASHRGGFRSSSEPGCR